MLNSFLSNVALVAGLGAILDHVLVTSSERKRLAAYLTKGTKNLSLTQRFSGFLEISHAVIFGRFFSTNIFSWRFFRSAAAISLISFGIVLFAQAYFFYEQFSQLTLDDTQLALFASFIVFNIIFDYVTIIQQKYLLKRLSLQRVYFGRLYLLAPI